MNKKKLLRFAALILMLGSVLTMAVQAAGEEVDPMAGNPFYHSFWALVPPIIAIALALITKEVYSSLFIGIVVGGLLYSKFDFEGGCRTK